jgi:hypothetical protein
VERGWKQIAEGISMSNAAADTAKVAAFRKELAAQLQNLPCFKALRNRRQRCFLAAFASCCDVKAAAIMSGCQWRSHYGWMEDPDYKRAFDFAKDIAGDVLEASMFDAAMHGDDRVVTFKGKVTSKYKQKSDIVRIFRLKGLKPQYRENFAINNFSGPIQLNVKFPSEIASPLDDSPALINYDPDPDQH